MMIKIMKVIRSRVGKRVGINERRRRMRRGEVTEIIQFCTQDQDKNSRR